MKSPSDPGPARQMAVFHVAGDVEKKNTKQTNTKVNKISREILSHTRETASFVCNEQRQNKTLVKKWRSRQVFIPRSSCTQKFSMVSDDIQKIINKNGLDLKRFNEAFETKLEFERGKTSRFGRVTLDLEEVCSHCTFIDLRCLPWFRLCHVRARAPPCDFLLNTRAHTYTREVHDTSHLFLKVVARVG